MPSRRYGPPHWPYTLNHGSPQAQGLVAWWPMDPHGAATVFDLSPKGVYPLTCQGATWGVATVAGVPCLKFVRASSQYAAVATTPVLAVPLSITAWVTSVDTTNSQEVVSIADTGSSFNSFRLNFGGNAVGDPVRAVTSKDAGSAIAVTTTGYVAGVEVHAAAVFAAIDLRAAYINGGSKGTETTSTIPAGIDAIHVGRNHGAAPSNYFDGSIRDVRIYNRALSAAEVYAAYDPSSRYDLYYQLRQRSYFLPAAAGGDAVPQCWTQFRRRRAG